MSKELKEMTPSELLEYAKAKRREQLEGSHKKVKGSYTIDADLKRWLEEHSLETGKSQAKIIAEGLEIIRSARS